MLDFNTTYLLLAMVGFIVVAMLLLHKHSCAETIRRKRNEVRNITHRLAGVIDTLEQEVLDLQFQIEEVDQRIDALKEQIEP